MEAIATCSELSFFSLFSLLAYEIIKHLEAIYVDLVFTHYWFHVYNQTTHRIGYGWMNPFCG